MSKNTEKPTWTDKELVALRLWFCRVHMDVGRWEYWVVEELVVLEEDQKEDEG